ncbi:MAG: quinoprotein relay system zinc metallohydrolase 2 [Gammaproteobacteria bacterium]
MAVSTGVAIAAWGLAHSGSAPAGDCPQPSAEIVEVAHGVYVRQGQHGIPFVDRNFANAGFIVGRDCVAVIDSGGALDEGKALGCAVAKVTDVPVCYVVVSHHHFDHALGNLAFKSPSVQIVGHDNLERSLMASADYYLSRLSEAAGETLSRNLIVPPTRTVSIGEPLELDLGGRVLSVTAHSPAHSDNDLSVLDRQTNTLWLSDLLFVEHIPSLDGSVLGWLEIMARLKQQPAARAIPGHGPVTVTWPDAMIPQERYFSVLRDEARALIEAGGDLSAATETIGQSEQPHWLMFDLHHKRNVTKVYTELEWE